MYSEIDFVQPKGNFKEALSSLHISLKSLGLETEAKGPKELHEIIEGGWGQDQQQAIIIKNPYAETEQIMEGPKLESALITMRNHYEFELPHAGREYAILMQKMDEQSLAKDDSGRNFDKVTFELALTKKENLEEIQPYFNGSKKLDASSMEFLKDKMALIKREYWFDITSFLEHNWLMTMKKEQELFSACAEDPENDEDDNEKLEPTVIS